MLPPRPDNDAARVAALRAHKILDTPPEPAFDELAQLAADICGTPIALITLVDEARQWFKARIGLDSTETPREESFCAHVICEPSLDVFEIKDTNQDPRFFDHPAVRGDLGVRFYAGTPLIDDDGWALGTLCVVDRRPRELTPQQRRGMAALRRFVINAIVTRRLVEQQKTIIAELEETRGQLDRARQKAENTTAAKARFLAMMSHEIRTPMNAVMGMSTLLGSTSLDAEQREYIDTIRGSGELLLTVINDVLDFSKIESGRLDLERQPFALADCLEGAAALVRPQIEKKGIRFVMEIDPKLPGAFLGDSVRIRQIVVNLLSNAMKFTAKGEITLRASGHALNANDWEVKITVADSGIGISQEQMENLFSEYRQANASTARLFGGTGLGLVISQRLAELHGGRMWVESEPGAGAKFQFTLRVTRTGDQRAGTAGEQPAAFDEQFAQQHPATILVADDNPVNLRVLTHMLRKFGYTPETATNGREALAKARAGTFTVVLMDVEMPELDGVDATRSLRSELPPDRQPAIVAVTAHVLADARQELLAAGMDEVLAKPIRIGELQTALAKVARRG